MKIKSNPANKFTATIAKTAFAVWSPVGVGRLRSCCCGFQPPESIIFTLLLLLALVACGGASYDDAEAIGSESAGDIVPTPVTGPKVLPTRVSAGTAVTTVPDILFVTQAGLLTADDLQTIATELAQPDAHFGLSLYGESGPVGAYDLTAEVETLTAVLNQSPTTIAEPLTIINALSAGIQLPDWRENGNPRLIFLITDTPVSPDDVAALTELVETAVSQNMQIFPILISDIDDPIWAELAERANGRLLTLAAIDDLTTVVIEAVEK